MGTAERRGPGGELWVEEPVGTRRLPDPVRTAAVRAVILGSLTLIATTVAFFCTVAGSSLAFPMVLASVGGTVVSTWGVLDVWVTRQVWNQRHGVVSTPRSTARRLRKERRQARRQARRSGSGSARARPAKASTSSPGAAPAPAPASGPASAPASAPAAASVPAAAPAVAPAPVPGPARSPREDAAGIRV
ncbi:hypothetical protein [Streptomyces indicus]|uniref:hypothetical protein n=1 Tax=Streptomyces indicus TaxID=417292 RepID=UPI003CCC42E7